MLSEKTVLIIIAILAALILIKTFKSELSGLVAALSGIGMIILAVVCCLVAIGIVIAILAFGLAFSIPCAIVVAAGFLTWYLWDKYQTWKIKRKFNKRKKS